MAAEQNNEIIPMVLVDFTGQWVNCTWLEQLKEALPKCESYICIKADYVTSQESQDISESGFKLVTSGMIVDAIEPVKDLNPQIYSLVKKIHRENDELNRLHHALFIEHDTSVLDTDEGMEYLMNTLAENLYEMRIPFDWNETNTEAIKEISILFRKLFCNDFQRIT
jgi:hypothetical protein